MRCAPQDRPTEGGKAPQDSEFDESGFDESAVDSEIDESEAEASEFEGEDGDEGVSENDMFGDEDDEFGDDDFEGAGEGGEGGDESQQEQSEAEADDACGYERGGESSLGEDEGLDSAANEFDDEGEDDTAF